MYEGKLQQSFVTQLLKTPHRKIPVGCIDTPYIGKRAPHRDFPVFFSRLITENLTN
jgi:hypothetical protein